METHQDALRSACLENSVREMSTMLHKKRVGQDGSNLLQCLRDPVSAACEKLPENVQHEMKMCKSRSAKSNRITSALFRNIGCLWRGMNGFETDGRLDECYGAKQFAKKAKTVIQLVYLFDQRLPDCFRSLLIFTIVIALGFRWHILMNMYRDLAMQLPYQNSKELLWLQNLSGDQEWEMMRIFSSNMEVFIFSQHQASHDRILTICS